MANNWVNQTEGSSVALIAASSVAAAGEAGRSDPDGAQDEKVRFCAGAGDAVGE